MKNIICLDYDGTYTDFPDLFNIVIDYCKKNNIRIILATMRSEEEKDSGLIYLEKILDKVIYTNRNAKAKYLSDIYGIIPDVWVDDHPEFILYPPEIRIPS